jgi:hypothetical protein
LISSLDLIALHGYFETSRNFGKEERSWGTSSIGGAEMGYAVESRHETWISHNEPRDIKGIPAQKDEVLLFSDPSSSLSFSFDIRYSLSSHGASALISTAEMGYAR